MATQLRQALCQRGILRLTIRGFAAPDFVELHH